MLRMCRPPAVFDPADFGSQIPKHQLPNKEMVLAGRSADTSWPVHRGRRTEALPVVWPGLPGQGPGSKRMPVADGGNRQGMPVQRGRYYMLEKMNATRKLQGGRQGELRDRDR
jgi:hypothetical protein